MLAWANSLIFNYMNFSTEVTFSTVLAETDNLISNYMNIVNNVTFDTRTFDRGNKEFEICKDVHLFIQYIMLAVIIVVFVFTKLDQYLMKVEDKNKNEKWMERNQSDTIKGFVTVTVLVCFVCGVKYTTLWAQLEQYHQNATDMHKGKSYGWYVIVCFCIVTLLHDRIVEMYMKIAVLWVFGKNPTRIKQNQDAYNLSLYRISLFIDVVFIVLRVTVSTLMSVMILAPTITLAQHDDPVVAKQLFSYRQQQPMVFVVVLTSGNVIYQYFNLLTMARVFVSPQMVWKMLKKATGL